MKEKQAETVRTEDVRQGRGAKKLHTARDGSPNSIRILIYHRIYPNTEPGRITPWDTSERVFHRHMQLLSRWGYSAITFHDYGLYLSGAVSLPKKPVIITFDDGNEEVATVAYPIMRALGMRGVVFLLGDRSIRINTWDLPVEPSLRLLTDQQALELHSAGFEIGAHSFQHKRLTDIPLADAWDEIYRSRMVLEFLLNAPVKCFAYPFGLVNDQVKRMVADAGYTLACGAYTGPAVYSEDLYELRRIRTYNSMNPLLFWFQLQSVYLHYRSLWWNVRSRIVSLLARIRSHIHSIPEHDGTPGGV